MELIITFLSYDWYVCSKMQLDTLKVIQLYLVVVLVIGLSKRGRVASQ